MTFNVNDFTSKINEVGDLYRPSLYKVRINFANGDFFMARKLEYLANSASLPGVQILSSDHRRQNYGTFDRRAFGVQVTDIPITFFVDQKGGVLEFFNKWLNRVVNFDQSGGEHGYGSNGGRLFEVGYRDDYESTIDITAYRPNGQVVIGYRLFEAFPIQMGDVTVAWAENDQFAVVPVQFTFRTYSTNRNTPVALHNVHRVHSKAIAEMDMINTGNVKPVATNNQE